MMEFNLKISLELQTNDREELERVKEAISVLSGEEKTIIKVVPDVPSVKMIPDKPTKRQHRRSKLTEEEKKERRREYQRRWLAKKHGIPVDREVGQVKPRSGTVKTDSAFCQNSNCANYATHTSFQRSVMVEYNGLLFCDQDCMEDFKSDNN
jgi:hypothetical protein